MYYGLGPNRLICSVLEEIRALDKTKNYSCLLSLVEEVQVLANRMEAALADVKDLERVKQYTREKREELKKLDREISAKEELISLTK